MLIAGQEETIESMSQGLLNAWRAVQDTTEAGVEEQFAQATAQAITEAIIALVQNHAQVQGTCSTGAVGGKVQ